MAHAGTGSADPRAALDIPDLPEVRWEKAPFIHIDCRLAGENWGHGGGRFLGLPATFLRWSQRSVGQFPLALRCPLIGFRLGVLAHAIASARHRL